MPCLMTPMTLPPRTGGPASRPPCIGVFDSGLGGLSVLQALCQAVTGVHWVYVADSGHAPYGERDEAYVMERCRRITAFLRAQGADMVVVACNTATAVAIDVLRREHPGLPFIGIEPGLKPALSRSPSGRVGVMATEATLRSPRFERLLKRWQGSCSVLCVPCPGLAQAIETIDLHHPALHALVHRCVAPLRDHGADTVVLGCTHYPWVAPAIQQALGPQVTLIDTASSVAAQAARVLAGLQGRNRSVAPSAVRAYASGAGEVLHRFARRHLPALDWPVPEPLPA